jgi:ketosteroid isomerase-like protein
VIRPSATRALWRTARQGDITSTPPVGPLSSPDSKLGAGLGTSRGLHNPRSPDSGSAAGHSKIDQARAAYAAWSARDLDAFVDVFSEDVEVKPFLGRGLGASTYRGHSGLKRWYEEATEEWEELRVEPHEFHEVGDRLAVFLRAVGRGRGSHVEVEAEIVHVAEFRDGKFTRLEGFGDREQALKALDQGA